MPTLNWRTREQDIKAAADTEYRLLVEEEKYSYGDGDTGNIIVQGDNLEALKSPLALLRRAGKMYLHRSALQYRKRI
jgi:adenine-specific DNA-methyltransferase